MDKCKVCNNQIKASDAVVRCYGCNSDLHNRCTTLSENTYKHMSRPAKEAWRCKFCKEGTQQQKKRKITPQSPANDNKGEEIEEEDDPEMKNMIKIIFNKLKDFEPSIWIDMCETLQLTKDRLDAVENKLIDKDVEIAQLKEQMEKIQREESKLMIEILNVPETKEEKLEDKVIGIVAKLNISIRKEDIVSAVRIQTKKERKPILIKFNRTRVREAILEAKKITEIKMEAQKIYFNEHTTKEKRILFAKAKSTAKSEGWKYTWIKHGKIHVKKGDEKESKYLVINKEEDLGKIK